MEAIYLDNAATTPLSDEVRAAMAPWLDAQFGNPSSRHPLGVRAAEAIDEARSRVARAVGARAAEVVFTSGGTEANNLAVLGLARARGKRGRHVLIGATEHPSVRESAAALEQEGFEVEHLPLLDGGELDAEGAVDRLRDDTVLVACMLVNNELGTHYDVARLARLVRANAPLARVHVDAIQALGKVPVSRAALGAHSLAISAHKIHGPKGTGALILEPGVEPRPLVFGGGQEDGRRPGTENVAGIVGLGVAAERAGREQPQTFEHISRLCEHFVQRMEALDFAAPLVVGARRSPAIQPMIFEGPPAEVWMHHFEAQGVFTSVGSACQAKSGEVAAGLLALGLSVERAKQVLRVSFGTSTSIEEIDRAADIMAAVGPVLGAKS